ncbi:hypothetical protein [Thauera sp.]|uniref:hypothetical protein n=1 Tax=Thauera sp. TaxID=1905334 RepID=UPI002A35C2FE|nr:hypothetical protein [Thauera sp.]MDX9885365.1 hypothetical protein [Thauera sp.]
MRTNHASTTRSPNPDTPGTVASHANMASNESEQHSSYSAWTAQRKRTIADLVDDQDALEDWHRNLARLRAGLKD